MIFLPILIPEFKGGRFAAGIARNFRKRNDVSVFGFYLTVSVGRADDTIIPILAEYKIGFAFFKRCRAIRFADIAVDMYRIRFGESVICI